MLLVAGLISAVPLAWTGEPEPQPVTEKAPPGPETNLDSRGLLELNDPFPLALIHLQLPTNPRVFFEKGKGQISVNFDWANSFVIDDADAFVVDAEIYRLQLGGWYALRRDLYVGASLPIHVRDDGILDPLITGFHDIFGFSNTDRNRRPKNEYKIQVTDADGTHEVRPGTGLGDLTLKLHWNLAWGTEVLPAVALQGLLGLPTSTESFGTDELDAGLAFAFSKTLHSMFHLHALIGISYFTPPEEVAGIQYEKTISQIVGGFEIRPLKRLSFISQAMVYSPLLETPEPLDQWRLYVAWGIKWAIVPKVEFTISLMENFGNTDRTADIAFSTGLAFQL